MLQNLKLVSQKAGTVNDIEMYQTKNPAFEIEDSAAKILV